MKRNNNRTRLELRRIGAGMALLAAFFIVGGCTETSLPDATGKGSVRGINSIVLSPEVNFLTEERSNGGVTFRAVAGFRDWDDLSYNFNFDIFLPDEAEPRRLATQFIDVVADTEYSLVLTGTIDNASILMWEEPERDWDDTETVFEVDFVHLSPLTGEVDIYYAVEGTVPVLGNEIGTLSYGGRINYRELPADDYEVIVTAPDDPGTIVFQSAGVARAGAERVTVALFDSDASLTSPIGVSIFRSNGNTEPLADLNSPSQLRSLHAAFGTPAIDGFFDGDLNNAVFSNIGFGEISAFEDLTEQLTNLTLTESGNTGNVLLDFDIAGVGNSRSSIVLWGQPGELFGQFILQDGRPLAVFPSVRITNFASNIEAIDIYDVEAGTTLDETVFPRFAALVPGVSSNFFAGNTGMREFIITQFAEQDPIAAPLAVDLADGEVLDIVILDTADPAVVSLLVIDSIP